MNEVIDEKDFAILDELKKNSKLSERKIAKKTNIPLTTIHNRIRKLRKIGVIESYTIKLNYKKLGKPLIAFVMLKVSCGDQKEMFEQIAKLPNVYEVAMVTGEFDLLFKTRVASMDELNELVVQKLRKLKIVGDSRTLICYTLVEKV